jgi:excisionase family DNA binding protein
MFDTKENRSLLTARETAKLLRVSPNTVYAQAQQGKLPHIRLGDRLLFPRAELLQWIAEQARASVRTYPH